MSGAEWKPGREPEQNSRSVEGRSGFHGTADGRRAGRIVSGHAGRWRDHERGIGLSLQLRTAV